MVEWLIDTFGEAGILGGAGLLVGILFGVAAQHSRFCLRAATAEVADGRFGPRLAVWLVAFTTALALVQAGMAAGVLSLDEARVLAATGSLSGAAMGGLMFGSGMILARGCASRLLVLASSGNLRALITGLVVTLVAQASYRGALSPAREEISALWTVPGGAARDLGAILNLSHATVALLAAGALAVALVFARSREVTVGEIAAAGGVGFAVALGWMVDICHFPNLVRNRPYHVGDIHRACHRHAHGTRCGAKPSSVIRNWVGAWRRFRRGGFRALRR